MCNKGIIETNPEVMKLEYFIVINEEIQQQLEQTISKLIGEEAIITSPKRGEYPDDRKYGKNTIIIETKIPRKWDSEVVRFSLQELPGCCGVMVSCHTHVRKPYQGKGINSFLQEIKQKIAKNNGYSLLLATVTGENKTEIHILEKYGWEKSSMFNNSRTNNDVIFYMKKL